MKTQLEQQILDNMTKDPHNWRGMFYYNKNDPRLIVKKQNPLRGWTLNFASSYSILTLVLIIVIAILSVLLIK